jgi:hypothetical protein
MLTEDMPKIMSALNAITKWVPEEDDDDDDEGEVDDDTVCAEIAGVLFL